MKELIIENLGEGDSIILLPGKIYYTQYGAWKHDSKPLIFVLSSDINKTHAINLHYFPSTLLVQFFQYVKKFQMKFQIMGPYALGKLIYKIMKMYYPRWIKTAYRTYNSARLTGYLINDGITVKAQSVVHRPAVDELNRRDSMIKLLNENLKASAITDNLQAPPPIQFARPQMGQASISRPPVPGQTTVMQQGQARPTTTATPAAPVVATNVAGGR